MLRLRPYNKNDAKIIMSWIKDETSFYNAMKRDSKYFGNYREELLGGKLY